MELASLSFTKSKYLKEYLEYLRFRSISTDPAFAKDCRQCADWLRSYLTDMGFSCEYWETKTHPVLFAERTVDPNAPTVCLYGHYDVQPVDPIELWHCDPFDPKVDDQGRIFARGAQDNKGQNFYTIAAVNELLRANPTLFLNIKFVIEGEEECGSSGLKSLCAEKKERLQSDYLLVVDVGIKAIDKPTLTLGIRGLVTMEMTLTGSKGDLHSGTHGGIVYNPNRALGEILGKLYDKNGHVTVPGFYDDIEALPKELIALLDLDFDEAHYKDTLGAAPTGGEKGFSPRERAGLRPTLEINGVYGGYAGEGFKTVIPAKAGAKISCRLVARQDPQKVAEKVAAYLKTLTPTGIDCFVRIFDGKGIAAMSRPDSHLVQEAKAVMEEVNNKPCTFVLEGASIPVTAELAKVSGADVLCLGYGLDTDNIHAPNENFDIDRLEKGFSTIFLLLSRLAQR